MIDSKVQKENYELKEQSAAQLRAIRKRIELAHGFIADPTLSVNHNAFLRLSSMTTFFYFYRPTNLAFHDLTSRLKPPANLRSLLGLGLKFIPTPDYTTKWSSVDDGPTGTLPRLHRSILLRCYFNDSPKLADQNKDYNPRMYTPSAWSPPPWDAPRTVTERLQNFCTTIRPLFRRPKIRRNLPDYQRVALANLQTQDDFLVVQCDKNLGPAIIERNEYIKLAYRDHLNDRSTYQLLTAAEASARARNLKTRIMLWLKTFHKDLSKGERRYINKETSACVDPFPYFYLTMKVHKTPLKTRPIVSCSGSLLYSLGIWVDDKLQKVARTQKAYFKSSFDLKNELTGLQLPPGAQFFTADAVSMYTNINTSQAIREIARYLRQHARDFPTVPVKALIGALRLVMTNNIIHFGDTFWLQLQGTAMGTPPAPPYANLFFAIHEILLLDEFKDNLFLYRRFIDDILGIWVPTDPTTDDATYTRFQRRTNEYHDLVWEFTDRAQSAIFMDLSLQIQGTRVTTTLYSKALNLYLYIPPRSAHPPGVLTGLVSGNILRIYTLCSDPDDVRSRLQDFWNRLISRGYPTAQIKPLFLKGLHNAREYIACPPTKTADTNCVFFHLRYHPQDPPSSEIQTAWRNQVSHPAYRTPLENVLVKRQKLQLSRLIICYSRPLNLSNLLSYRKLRDTSGPPVSSFKD